MPTLTKENHCLPPKLHHVDHETCRATMKRSTKGGNETLLVVPQAQLKLVHQRRQGEPVWNEA